MSGDKENRNGRWLGRTLKPGHCVGILALAGAVLVPLEAADAGSVPVQGNIAGGGTLIMNNANLNKPGVALSPGALIVNANGSPTYTPPATLVLVVPATPPAPSLPTSPVLVVVPTPPPPAPTSATVTTPVPSSTPATTPAATTPATTTPAVTASSLPVTSSNASNAAPADPGNATPSVAASATTPSPTTGSAASKPAAPLTPAQTVLVIPVPAAEDTPTSGASVLLQSGDSDQRVFIRPATTTSTDNDPLAKMRADLASVDGNVYALAGNNGGIVRATATAMIGGHAWLKAAP